MHAYYVSSYGLAETTHQSATSLPQRPFSGLVGRTKPRVHQSTLLLDRAYSESGHSEWWVEVGTSLVRINAILHGIDGSVVNDLARA